MVPGKEEQRERKIFGFLKRRSMEKERGGNICSVQERKNREGKNLIEGKYLVNRGKGVMALGREFAI